MDDGLGGSFSTMATITDFSLTYTISTFPINSLGKMFRIYLTALNSEGIATSGIVSIMLAKEPEQPSKVKVVRSESDKDQLTVEYDPLTSP